jgi:hypothetical protein
MDEIITAFKVAGMDELYLDAVRLAYIAGYRSTHTWFGLTKNEMETLSYEAQGNTLTAVELAEAKLKEKNT